MQVALRFLERRARTEKELRQKLADKKISSEDIDSVIKKLKDYGYINDEKFVRDFQRTKDDYKPMGKHRIKMELYQKGVPKEIIETVYATREKEYDLALRAAETHLRQYANLDRETFYRRMSGFLARRGFDYAIIKKVINDLKPSS